MRAHSSLRLGTLRGTTPELLASPWYCAWGFCMVWEAGLPHKTSSPLTQRRNGRACSSLTARGGGLPVGVMRGGPHRLTAEGAMTPKRLEGVGCCGGRTRCRTCHGASFPLRYSPLYQYRATDV